MATDLLTLLQRFELLTFFTGYPLLYTLVSIVEGYRPAAARTGRKTLIPTAYALLGTLFLLFLIWQANRSVSLGIVALRLWGVLAMLFWIPRLRSMPILSLLHSLVFFGLMVQDMIIGLATPTGRDQIRNDMTIFSISFLLNATLFVLILLAVFIRRKARPRPGV